MGGRSTVLTTALIAMVSYVAAAPQSTQTAGVSSPEKREHTVYILDMRFSSNEQGLGTLVLVLDALPRNTNIIRVVNKSKSPHGFEMQIKSRKFRLDNPIAPGKTAQFEFTALADLRASEGVFYSPVGDDPNMGSK